MSDINSKNNLHSTDVKHHEGKEGFKYTTTYLDFGPIELMGVSRKVDSGMMNSNDPTQNGIYQAQLAYSKVFQNITTRKKEKANLTYCVYSNYRTKMLVMGLEFDYFIGQEVLFVPNDKLEGVSNISIPRGRYAKFSSTGKIEETLKSLWEEVQNFMMSSEEFSASKGMECHFEMYDAFKMQNPEKAEIQVFVCLNREQS